jgi:hypothetical protein
MSSPALPLGCVPFLSFTQALYAAVAQENIPLGPLSTLMPLLQMAGVLNDVPIKSALKVGLSHFFDGGRGNAFLFCLFGLLVG